MKNFFYILFISILAVSCTKEVDDTLDKINETLIGSYECRAVTIHGQELDLDGDGTTSNDMMAELELYGFRWLWKTPLHMYPVRERDGIHKINFEIPKLFVHYEKISGTYSFRGEGSTYVPFFWWIDPSGKICTKPDEKGAEDISYENIQEIGNMDFKGNVGKELTFDQQGTIKALINCTCYDFATNKVLNVPVLFEYERVSYSH